MIPHGCFVGIADVDTVELWAPGAEIDGVVLDAHGLRVGPLLVTGSLADLDALAAKIAAATQRAVTRSPGPWFLRPPMEGVIRQGSTRAYGHTIGPAQKLLAAWVAGRSLDARIDWQAEYLARPDPDFPGYLKIAGTWQPHSGTLVWSASFAQAGYPDRSGMAGGCGSAEDACDRALDLVREDEAARVAEIVVGLA